MKKIILPLIIISLFASMGIALATKPVDNQDGAQKIDWNLSGAVMPIPPYGSGDIVGSDTASKLIVNQPNGKIGATITGAMNGLTPNTTYTVYLSNAYEPYRLTGWNVLGDWIIDFEWNGGHYPNDVIFTTQDGNNISGTIGWPSGSNPYSVIGTVSGIIDNNGVVSLTVQYNDRSYLRTMTGTVDSNGQFSGSWIDANLTDDHGVWTSTRGQSTKTHTGDMGWPGFFIGTIQPFTFITDDSGSGSWHLNLKSDETTTGSSFSVWINGASGTMLISDNINIK